MTKTSLSEGFMAFLTTALTLNFSMVLVGINYNSPTAEWDLEMDIDMCLF